jgi:Rho GDP-dissociation inhibitor
MADEEVNVSPALNYKPPAEKSLNEILEADKDDDSLRRYKETLLGSASKTQIVVDPSNPNTVIIKSLTLIPDDHEPLVLDLSGNYVQHLSDLSLSPLRTDHDGLIHLLLQAI